VQVKGYDLVDLATRNLRESKLRNSLTTIGIAVGVASLVAMLSLGVGLQELANRRIGKSGLFDSVFVTSKQDMRGMNRDRDDREENEAPTNATAPARLLDDSARHDIEAVTNVTEAVPEVRVVTELRYNDKHHTAFLAGVPRSAGDSEAFENMKGHFFSSATAREAILQNEFASELEPKDPQSLIGKEVVVRFAERKQATPDGTAGATPEASSGSFSVVRRNENFKIVGIIEEEPYGGMRMISRARLFIPTEAAESLNMMQFFDAASAMRGTDPNAKAYSMLTVKVSSPGKVQQVQETIKKMGFRTYSILDATKSLRRFFTIFDMFLGIFGSLALAVASLAIINTLVMAVLERRREIGIMKAIGASDSDVKRLFFAEAGTMGVIGGLVGVGLGWLIGSAINFGTAIYMRRQQLPPENVWSVPWWLVLGAVGFAVLVSLLAGLYPASRAAKLDPIQALRYE
jgi:putative ABC transport system permease protein